MPTSAAAPLLVFGGCIEKGVCVEISPKDAWVYASIFRIPNPFRNRCQVPLPSPFARFPILRSLVCRENSRNALQCKHLGRKRMSSSAAGRGRPRGFKFYEAGKDIVPVEAVSETKARIPTFAGRSFSGAPPMGSIGKIPMAPTRKGPDLIAAVEAKC